MGRVLQGIGGLISLLAILVLTTGLVFAGPSGKSDQVQITVLSVNDFHGALLEDGGNPGVVKWGKYLKDEKALNADGTIILSAGDMFQGSAESNLLHGKPVVQAMNNIGFDGMALGNHEFDWGITTLQQQARSSRFPYLAANITDKATGNQLPFVKPYTILERNGVKIAIIGLTTLEAAYKSNPQIVNNLIFNQPAEVVNSLVPKLRNEGAQLVIVLAHLGCEIDSRGVITGEAADLAKKVSGVDLIITGHSHKNIVGRVNGIPIVQAYYNGRATSKATFLYSLSENKIISSIITNNNNIQPVEPYDKGLAWIVERTNAEVGTAMKTTLGTARTTLTHDRYELSLLGQWITDNMRKTAAADIAFLNGGGIRAPIPAGKITLRHVYQALPFDNTLYVTELTGRQIIAALEYSFANRSVGMLQYSGLKVRYNNTNSPSNKLVAVATIDGVPLRPDKVYKVAMNDFLAVGGDGFTMLSQGRNGQNTMRLLRDVVVSSIRSVKHINITGDNRLTYETVLIIKQAS
ncbi:Mannosylglucosyl-3-phosphoglycerate phosphatase [bioreactor metagenome]|uniref:Mannosylglucosyl-3-phosphoglycerate phosphatase n=1 Tax=bioreactor metagenome TaxID=1076179 RepID=A0A644ZB76_9ZZZZ